MLTLLDLVSNKYLFCQARQHAPRSPGASDRPAHAGEDQAGRGRQPDRVRLAELRAVAAARPPRHQAPTCGFTRRSSAAPATDGTVAPRGSGRMLQIVIGE